MAKTTEKFSEDELLDQLSQVIGNPMEVQVDAEDHVRIIDEMSKIDGIQEFFRASMGIDMRLYFLAKSDKERDIVRGHFNCLAWLRKQMKNVESIKTTPKKASKVA